MQRAPHARESRQQLFQGAGFSAADVLQNIEAVTANTIHRDITPPTISAQEEVLKTFHQYVEVMKDSEGYQALNLHSAFDAGASLLSLTVIIGFINYICLSSRGLIDDRITVVTLQNKIGLFLGLTTRLTGKSYASEVTQQLYAYADGECCRSFGLCRDVRVKPVADKVDMSRLLQQLWHPSHSTQSTRMRRQIGFCIKKAALTSSRPGQDVESSAAGYKNTNESLEWRDAEFMILPANSPVPVDDLDPATTAQSMQPSGRPRLCVKLTARLQKGKRGKKGQTLATVFLPEEISPSQPFSGPGHCVVTDLIVMAMADGVFENVRDFDQLGRLMKAVQPGQTIRLQMKDACLKIPILRAYTDGTHFIISQKKALKYAALYKQYESLGKGAGFEDDFRPYCLRRMGGNTLEESAAVTSAQRTQLMGHNQFSRIFQTNYLNTLVAVDLSAIAAGRVEDREAIKAVGRMSMNADVNAPISLSPAGLKRLLQIEEVDKARRVVDQAQLNRTHARQGGLPMEEAERLVRSTYKTFRAVFLRHQRVIFAEERKQWFANAEQRVLASASTSVEDPDPVTILADEEEEQDLENLDISARIEKFQDLDFNHLTTEQLQMLVREGGYEEAMRAQAIALARDPPTATTGVSAGAPAPPVLPHLPRGKFTNTVIQATPEYEPTKHFPPDLVRKLFYGGFVDDGTVDSQIAVWKYLSNLPERPVQIADQIEISTYEGEYASADGTCPRVECPMDFKTVNAKSMTKSKRAIHLHQCYREMKLQSVNEDLAQKYPDLPLSDCPVNDCHSDTPETFTAFVKHVRTHHALRKECRIGDCDAQFANHSDLWTHLEVEHGIPFEGYIMFCYWCHTWSTSPQEDFRHRQAHFTSEWEPRRLHSDSDIPAEDRPSYATAVDTGLVRNPGICPFCLWNSELQKSKDLRWMHQETASNLETHIIKHHHHALADQRAEGELLACPCLMCPQSRKANMTLLELYNHLITVHGIPLQGKRKAQSQGQLHPLGHLKDVKKPNNAGKKWVLYRVDVEDKKNTGAKRVTAVGADSDEGSDVDFGSETLGIEAEEDECQVLSASDEELLAEPLLANDSAAYVVYGLAAMDTDAVSSADADADADTDVVSCAVLDADTALDADAVSGADAPAALDADMDADVVSGAALDAGAVSGADAPAALDADTDADVVSGAALDAGAVLDADTALDADAVSGADADADADEFGVEMDLDEPASGKAMITATSMVVDEDAQETTVDLCSLLQTTAQEIPGGAQPLFHRMMEFASANRNTAVPRAVLERGLDNSMQALLQELVDIELREMGSES